MPNRKITAFTSAASAQASTIYPIVSGGNANKIVTQHTMLKSLGIPQYVEGTCQTTTTVANLPSNSTIFDIYVKALVGSSAGAGGAQVDVGAGTAIGFYASIITSGQTLARPAGGDWNTITRLQLTSGAVIASRAAGVSAGANFVVGIGYFRV